MKKTKGFSRSLKNSDNLFKGFQFFDNLITSKLRSIAENIESLESGEYKFSKHEINQRTKELYAEVKNNIKAVSFIDIRQYWGSPEYGPEAIEMNRQASEHGTKVERIFIFHRPEEIVRNIQILSTLQQSVTLYYTFIKDLEKKLQVDFSLYDGKYVQHFEFEESTFNKEYKECTISMKPATIEQFNEKYKELFGTAKPLKPLLDEYQSVHSLDGKSIWIWPEIYDHYSTAPPNLHLEKLEPPVRTVLDIGCGVGRALELFALMGCEVTGIDEDSHAIELCQNKFRDRKIGPIKFINDRFRDGSLNDAKFDVVIAYNSIYHCKKEEFFSVIKHISKILNPGGYLLLTVKTVDGNQAVFEGATQIEPNTWIGCNYPDYQVVHHFCTYEEIAEIEALFSKTVYKEEIPLVRSDGMIVQGQGFYMMLRKALSTV